MKKCKWLAAALIAAVGLILSGCGNTSGAGGGGDEEKKTPVSPAILKADISKAAYVASTHIEKEKPVTVLQNVRAARDVDDAGDEKNPGTVVVVNTDGSINYDALGFTEGFKSLLKTEDAWLYDVVDVQQCDKGEDTNKGTYIMFDWTRTGWKYSDGTEAPDLGQVIFINKEGKLFDIFNNDGKARDGIAWNIKDEYGNEYIYFDNKGNIFILGFEWEYGKDWTYTVYRWNPTNGLKKFPLPVIVNNGLIRDFAISDDGSWIFVNAKYVEDCKYNDVYMINVNDGTRETLYRSAEGENDCVNKLCVGPDNKLYFYVDCQDVSKDGLFVLPKTTSGYSKDKLKRYMGLSWWNVNEFISKEITGTAKWDYVPAVAAMKDFDYTKLLDFIKTYINYKGEMDFTLDYYKDKTEVQCYWGTGENEQGKMDFSALYAEDADGNPLKNEAALKHIFETVSTLGVAEEGTSLWAQEFYWDCVFSERQQGYKVLSQASFPLDLCFVKKGTKESVFESSDIDFIKAPYATIKDGVFVANDLGIWVYEDIFEPVSEGSAEWSHTRARFLNIFDEEGHFKKNPFAGDLETTQFWPVKDGLQYGGEDHNSKHLPYAANSKGVAGISKNKKTIYYQDGENTVNLLANYTGNAITEIVSFNLDEKVALVNASIDGGNYVTLNIDLASKTVTNLKVNKPLDSIVRR